MIFINKIWNRLKDWRFILMRVSARFVLFRKMYSLLQPNCGHEWDKEKSIFSDLEVEKVVKVLGEEGYCTKGITLPQKTLKNILVYSESFPCYADQDPTLGFFYKDYLKLKKRGYSFMTAHYPNIVSQCSDIKLLSKDPKLWDIAERYLGFFPKLINSSMWWVFPKESSEHERNIWAQLFHNDVDDYKFLKFFFYLTDVDLDSAPHVYVPKSHLIKKWKHQIKIKRRTDKEIIETYGENNIISIEGLAGRGFAGDTFCFHKAQVPKKGNRLLLQFLFAKNNFHKDKDEVDSSTQRMILE